MDSQPFDDLGRGDTEVSAETVLGEVRGRGAHGPLLLSLPRRQADRGTYPRPVGKDTLELYMELLSE